VNVGDLATMLVAAGTFLSGVGSVLGIPLLLARTSKQERRKSASRATRKVLEATADGKVTPEEAAEALRELYGEADGE
jgi:hypothetical protein